ncbi:hypothetical protein L3X38_004441 [Prunus dulcis]|uniref:Uncharacterized protein n=1 Tax=Prunus dulcis TaxID=3755 RepID=A0AAD4ZNW5_PRUDU|nr:hypothetical protein L3X38_004441 [Prunus dulcis]
MWPDNSTFRLPQTTALVPFDPARAGRQDPLDSWLESLKPVVISTGFLGLFSTTPGIPASSSVESGILEPLGTSGFEREDCGPDRSGISKACENCSLACEDR